ncbi:MAG: ABC transporter ATP-binding protein [Burkholderiaceae bacterium]
MTPRLALSQITKRYPTVVANDSVSVEVMPGEILAILGENGAGKSTLMKIIYGTVQPDAGEMRFDGQRVSIESPAHARELGIAMVFQHFALFDTLTVAENVALGLPGGRSIAAIDAELREVAGRYGLPIDPASYVHELSMGERQRVEILRALLTNPQLLILDEPTSVLTPQAVGILFETLRQLASEGVSIVFISHKLDEIRRLAHRCVVMRAGRMVASVDPRSESEASLARLMIGDEPPSIASHTTAPGEVVLRAVGVVNDGDERGQGPLRQIALEVRRGQILGIAGISGNGQAQLLRALAGETRGLPESAFLFGEPIGHLGPRERRARGLRYVPEERLGHGAVPEMTLTDNALLTGDSLHSAGFLKRGAAVDFARQVIARYGVKAGGPQAIAASLSGGNLQKYIIGREIDNAPRVLLVSQPTWGVDVGAATVIRNALVALRDAGCAIIVVSEELDELFELSDVLMVMARGHLSPAVAAKDISVGEIGRWMAGLWPGGPAAADDELRAELDA